MRDFVKASREAGCVFEYFDDSKALRHNSGWCHRVDAKDKADYERVFINRTKRQYTDTVESSHNKPSTSKREQESLLGLIQKSGFPYVDNRSNGGSLWIIAGETEGKLLIDECKKWGISFVFTAKGGRASKKQPAWYSVSAR